MRTATALTGLLLLACGAFALALGLGVLGQSAAKRPLPAPGDHWWAWPAATALTLVGLLWLALEARAVFRRYRPALDGPTRMVTRAAAGDLITDARRLPGVRDLKLRLTGTAARPRLLLDVTCAPGAPLADIYTTLARGPVPRYRTTTDLQALTVVIRFQLSS
ncbi:hypothetical protein [Spirillospora sp. CA-294931]|uniref:hypothetical protein n=1 Tax=Spirillospora sp. CA-294931 TaxID=3240042 RepID=UPI003D8C37A0